MIPVSKLVGTLSVYVLVVFLVIWAENLRLSSKLFIMQTIVTHHEAKMGSCAQNKCPTTGHNTTYFNSVFTIHCGARTDEAKQTRADLSCNKE